MKFKTFLPAAAALLLLGSALQAKVTFPSVISDNMVLQQQTNAALWGTAEPGKKVTVTVSWAKGKTVTTADSQTGKWMVRVATPKAGGPYEITVSDGEKVTLRNVLIGEVWFCSGQSNMEMPVKGYPSQPAIGGTEAIVGAKASTPIRICKVQRSSSPTIKEDIVGTWQEHTPSAVAEVSATAYFFARSLQNVIDVPVGIIVSSWGGSSIETWMRREVIEKDFPEFSLAHLDGEPYEKGKQHQLPALLWNGMVAPVIPYTFKGMIWYQGETNRGRCEQYTRLQSAYVQMMRDDFQVPDAPFYFVQIAPYSYGKPDDTASGYFYEAQARTLEIIPHSGMAVTADIGELGTIHPCRKQEVGLRLALLALQNDYGCDAIEAEAPTFKEMTIEEDGKVRVTFNVKNGLSPMGTVLDGFELAGEDRVFHPAKGWLDSKARNVIIVTSAEVPDPVAVRYCFHNWFKADHLVYNNFGIPAAPFRTDDWEK